MQPTSLNPLVSIFIITHNRSRLLINAIDSVIKQTYENIEIIVIDDYSTDDTQEVVKKLQNKYSKLKYIKLPVQSGANTARNQGILAANGEFVTGLDDDDEMLPHRITKLMEAYSENFAYVYSQVYYVYPNKTKIKRLKIFGNTVTLEHMLYANITGNQVFTTREMYLQAGLYDENLPSAQDYDMWLKLLSIKPIARIVREPLMKIDRNDKIGRISTSKRHLNGYFQVYKKYKHLMTKDQRRFQLFKLRMAKKKRVSCKSFINYFTFKHIVLYVYLNLKQKLLHD